MKKRLICAFLVLVTVLSLCACSGKTGTELAVKGIRSMTADNIGNVYLLTDNGLKFYLLSGDKSLKHLYYNDVVYDKEGFAEAKLDWIKNGKEITYSDLYVDRLRCIGEDGITMIGKYTSNNSGLTKELFVIQDAFDMNFSAAYLLEMDKEGSKNFINGIADTENGIYFKLNRSCEDGEQYDDGTFFSYTGTVSPKKMPDNVTDAVETDNGCLFLVESKKKLELNDGEKTVKAFDRSKIADAFVQDNTVYLLYKDGTVTVADENGNESVFMKVKGKISSANDTFIYDKTLYWFDKSGIKYAK